jgi:hypothetical protein
MLRLSFLLVSIFRFITAWHLIYLLIFCLPLSTLVDKILRLLTTVNAGPSLKKNLFSCAWQYGSMVQIKQVNQPGKFLKGFFNNRIDSTND